jgi:hypothetical protein
MWKLVGASTLIVTAAAVAQSPEDAPGRDKARNDQDRIVCVNQGALGTRLTQRRVCRTRAEWAERRSGERTEVERWQLTGKPTFCRGGGC